MFKGYPTLAPPPTMMFAAVQVQRVRERQRAWRTYSCRATPSPVAPLAGEIETFCGWCRRPDARRRDTDSRCLGGGRSRRAWRRRQDLAIDQQDNPHLAVKRQVATLQMGRVLDAAFRSCSLQDAPDAAFAGCGTPRKPGRTTRAALQVGGNEHVHNSAARPTPWVAGMPR